MFLLVYARTLLIAFEEKKAERPTAGKALSNCANMKRVPKKKNRDLRLLPMDSNRALRMWYVSEILLFLAAI